jgi:hypothetical protein
MGMIRRPNRRPAAAWGLLSRAQRVSSTASLDACRRTESVGPPIPGAWAICAPIVPPAWCPPVVILAVRGAWPIRVPIGPPPPMTEVMAAIVIRPPSPARSRPIIGGVSVGRAVAIGRAVTMERTGPFEVHPPGLDRPCFGRRRACSGEARNQYSRCQLGT